MRVKYIGFYDFPNSDSKRVSNLAATNKMDYICSAIVRAGYNVEIISPSWIGDNEESKFQRQRTVKVDDNISVTFCPSWQTNNKISRNIKIIFSLTWLFLYLIFNAKKNEKILAYHVQWISIPIRMAKFFKRFELILEVEEIYSDVSAINDFFVKMEEKLISVADAYLFSTELLKERIKTEKPFSIIYGVYDSFKENPNPINDGKIHLLYTGIIDSQKKGAFNALECCKYLSDDYVLHIIGFGEVKRLCERIAELNTTSQCQIIYDGIKSGEEYAKYCQKCHIGLSTQSMEGKYLQSSFPSKILSYLSMGLRVVSCNVDCVSKSRIGDLVTYYYKDNPENIAQAIMSIDINQPYDSKTKIIELDNEFITDLKRILEN